MDPNTMKQRWRAALKNEDLDATTRKEVQRAPSMSSGPLSKEKLTKAGIGAAALSVIGLGAAYAAKKAAEPSPDAKEPADYKAGAGPACGLIPGETDADQAAPRQQVPAQAKPSGD